MKRLEAASWVAKIFGRGPQLGPWRPAEDSGWHQPPEGPCTDPGGHRLIDLKGDVNVPRAVRCRHCGQDGTIVNRAEEE